MTKWIKEHSTWKLDNGKEYVRITCRLYGRYNLQFYNSLNTINLEKEYTTSDLAKALRKGREWLGL
ncbi:hypothetical protein ACIFOT_13010 [Neobacillus sp. NRS-1170]|uniref:hypothetical protein n=1 Tax=Neobacillus sp. NRS-1170 TaxID=3233898 RepID=UPI003D2B49B2